MGWKNQFQYLGVSKNNGTPKSSILIGCSIIFTIHFGYPYFWLGTLIHTKRWFTFFSIHLCNIKSLLKDDRVVDMALNQAAKPWVSPIFRSGLVPSVADCFRKCRGDKSATLDDFPGSPIDGGDQRSRSIFNAKTSALSGGSTPLWQ